MAGITQVVDRQVEQIRKERAELNELRASLELRAQEISRREQEYKEELEPLSDRRATIIKELDDAKAEIERLRADRHSSIDTFGTDMDQIHSEKIAESESQAKQLRTEINFLLKGKGELEEEITALKDEIKDLEEKVVRDQGRAYDEQEAYLNRIRAEREADLKEINLAHSIAVGRLDSEKKNLEDEITTLEQTRSIEWNKVEAEVARYKAAQMAELEDLREIILAEAEKEKANILNGLRTEEREQHAIITRHRREWDQEILGYQSQKETLLDEIKLLEYDFEKIKSENIVKAEKQRLDEHKALVSQRAETLANLEDEQAALAAEWKTKIAELRNSHRTQVTAAEQEILEYENKRASIIRDIDQLASRFDQTRAENEVALEALRGEKLKEIDEQRLSRLSEVEQLRQERIAALENAYFTRASELEVSRNDKMDACRQAIDDVEKQLSALKLQRDVVENDLEVLRAEHNKHKEESSAFQKAAMIERQFELEKMANERLAEIEELCASRISFAENIVKRLTKEGEEADEKIAAQKSAANGALASMRRQIANLESELAHKKEDQLVDVQKDVITAMDELSKMKLEKLSEIEVYLETYKEERLANIQKDLDRQLRTNFKQVDELESLNDDYNKRMKELQELALTLEGDKRNIYFREQRYQDELSELKERYKTEVETHRREMAVLSDAKEQQIVLLQNQLKHYADIEAENHSMALRRANNE